MAAAELIEQCPECGSSVMKNPDTGLVACLASVNFGPCKWMVRALPWEIKHRKDKMTKREQKIAELAAEVRRRIEEAE